MNIFFDTNIFLRLTDENSSQHEIAARATAVLFAQGATCYFAPQSMVEFWAVASRPVSVNGLGLSLLQVEDKVNEFLDEYELLEENPSIFTNWQNLATKYQVVGKQVHDTKLVATMLTHNIKTILTLNTNDFLRFSEIKTLHPTGVLEETNQ